MMRRKRATVPTIPPKITKTIGSGHGDSDPFRGPVVRFAEASGPPTCWGALTIALLRSALCSGPLLASPGPTRRHAILPCSPHQVGHRGLAHLPGEPGDQVLEVSREP